MDENKRWFLREAVSKVTDTASFLKAFQLLEKGHDIEILSETEFLSRIKKHIIMNNQEKAIAKEKKLETE